MDHKVSFKQINRLAIPAIIAGIAEPLLSITDTAIVGNIPVNATESLAAVGIAGSFLSALFWILAQSRSAISAIIAQYLGAGKLDEVKSLPAQMILINVLFSALLYGITVIIIRAIFNMYNADGLVMAYATSYYKIRAIGLPFTLFVFSVFGVFRGLQNTYYPMLISIVGVTLNIALDYALVFGVPGVIKPLYVNGAAYASVIAQVTMAMIALYLLLKKTPFTLRVTLPFNKEIGRVLQLSFNLFLRAIALNVAIYFANAYATKYGNNYIATQTIAFQIWLFFAFFMDGFSSVGNIVSGKLLGERSYKKMHLLTKDLCKYCVLIGLMLGAICFVFYYPIGRIFTNDKDVLDLFYSIFWIVILMQPLNAIAFIYDGVFKGLAEAVNLRNVLFIATFIAFIPVLWIGDYFNLKLYAIWIAFTVWMIVRGFSLHIIFKRKYLSKVADS